MEILSEVGAAFCNSLQNELLNFFRRLAGLAFVLYTLVGITVFKGSTGPNNLIQITTWKPDKSV
jgi:hypothetical protein